MLMETSSGQSNPAFERITNISSELKPTTRNKEGGGGWGGVVLRMNDDCVELLRGGVGKWVGGEKGGEGQKRTEEPETETNNMPPPLTPPPSKLSSSITTRQAHRHQHQTELACNTRFFSSFLVLMGLNRGAPLPPSPPPRPPSPPQQLSQRVAGTQRFPHLAQSTLSLHHAQ